MSEFPPDNWDDEEHAQKGKTPPAPHDDVAEARLIAALLLGNGAEDGNAYSTYLDAVDRNIIRELRAGDFYDKRHSYIWSAIVAVGKAHGETAVDPVMVANNLRGHDTEDGKKSLLALAGGPEYLARLAAAGDSFTNLIPYVVLVQKCADLRRMVAVLAQNHRACFNAGDTPIAEIVGKAESEIFALGEEIRGGGSEKRNQRSCRRCGGAAG